jgi:hypothetical protein
MGVKCTIPGRLFNSFKQYRDYQNIRKWEDYHPI